MDPLYLSEPVSNAASCEQPESSPTYSHTVSEAVIYLLQLAIGKLRNHIFTCWYDGMAAISTHTVADSHRNVVEAPNPWMGEQMGC